MKRTTSESVTYRDFTLLFLFHLDEGRRIAVDKRFLIIKRKSLVNLVYGRLFVCIFDPS